MKKVDSNQTIEKKYIFNCCFKKVVKTFTYAAEGYDVPKHKIFLAEIITMTRWFGIVWTKKQHLTKKGSKYFS